MKRILTIGVDLAHDDVEEASFLSKASLLDWDIIVIRPTISTHFAREDTYQGKPSYDEDDSFRLKESCEHWRREIKEAVEAGKSVVVYLPELEDVFVDTGERTHSGTGRNQKTTRLVTSYDNFKAIPAELQPVAATGTAMKLAMRRSELLAPYWAQFGDSSQYKVVLGGENIPACVLTQSGDRPVGALYRSKLSAGSMVLLPDLDFERDEFIEETDQEWSWTSEAVKFARQLIAEIVELDKALRQAGEVTPEPEWAQSEAYALTQEHDLKATLLEAERDVEVAQKRKEDVEDQLRSVRSFRGLLFEKGKPLENVIISALQALGFVAEPYRDSDSEFDVVFESEEGRLIGEAEGKDRRAIGIDKLRQLSMNIHEDLERDEVNEPAKAVLFGNPFRLSPVDERDSPFSQKCVRAAESSSTALLFTPDLFAPTRYLLSHDDAEYAKSCRVATLSAIGRVVVPAPPRVEDDVEEEDVRQTQVDG